jgi:hypothetical protein
MREFRTPTHGTRPGEPLGSFVLTLSRLEFLIERGLITWDCIHTSSLVPELFPLVDILSREREKFDSLEILGFMTRDRFVIEGVKVKARNAFRDRLYDLFREILSLERPGELIFRDDTLSVRWARVTRSSPEKNRLLPALG